ncbi:MAG: TlpA family protein disulfide reductase [Lachnospiraceae bacterium]|nr:TlpA family protein disulfide reductase [Lachnospiraceae bacterium]
MKKKYLVAVVCVIETVALCGCGLFGKSEEEIQELPEDVVSEEIVSESSEDVIAEEPEESESLGTGEFEENEGLDVNEPVEEPEEAAGGARGYFTTTDLYGNAVTQEIFAQSDLTVVNVWATYCGPCINEMPYLGELAEEYDSSKVQIVGIPTDVYNQEYLDYALSLVNETGADYTHLLMSEELYNWGLTEIQYVPTTFFVNSEGEIIDTVVGSMSKEDWKTLIDEKLASL